MFRLTARIKEKFTELSLAVRIKTTCFVLLLLLFFLFLWMNHKTPTAFLIFYFFKRGTSEFTFDSVKRAHSKFSPLWSSGGRGYKLVIARRGFMEALKCAVCFCVGLSYADFAPPDGGIYAPFGFRTDQCIIMKA